MMSDEKQSPVAVVAVPHLSQSHLNQMLQLACLISSAGLPVYYVSTALHNRQVKSRCATPQDMASIHFHDIPTPPIPSLPPNPNSRYPSHLKPVAEAALSLRAPFSAFLRDTAPKFTRLVVVHDPWMSHVVQDIAHIHNAESYQFVCISAFSSIAYQCEMLGLPFPLPHPTPLPAFNMSDGAKKFAALQAESYELRSGTICNTSKSIEAAYMDVIEKSELSKNKLAWTICPNSRSQSHIIADEFRHECLQWLDKQKPRSVMFVSFGNTVTLSDEETIELAQGLMQSGVKFLWVLRDADKCDVFDGDVRRAALPEGFGERDDQGFVVREWAPQPQILAHPAIGGFMSHCGWNSCVESITAGVAIAAWPMHSDQPTNAALVADILKTGVVVMEWKDREEVVRAAKIESVVRRLMASEEGERIRKTAEELGAAVREAGGELQVQLDSFIAHITR